MMAVMVRKAWLRMKPLDSSKSPAQGLGTRPAGGCWTAGAGRVERFDGMARRGVDERLAKAGLR